jgi:hypothetical protein
MVKSRLSPDVMLDKLVQNSLMFHQPVLLRDIQLTKNFHNALSQETSHKDVVTDEFGLVTELLKVAKMLVALKTVIAHEFKLQLVDQIKILFKNSFHIQFFQKNVTNALNFLVNATLNSVTSQVLVKKTLNQSTVWTMITVVKSCWNVFHQSTNVLDKSATDTGDTLSPSILVMFTKKATVNLALVIKITLGFVMMNEILAQIIQNAPKTNTSLQLNLGVTTATTLGEDEDLETSAVQNTPASRKLVTMKYHVTGNTGTNTLPVNFIHTVKTVTNNKSKKFSMIAASLTNVSVMNAQTIPNMNFKKLKNVNISKTTMTTGTTGCMVKRNLNADLNDGLTPLILAVVNNQKNVPVVLEKIQILFVKLKPTVKLIPSLPTTVSEMDMTTVRLVTVTNGTTVKPMSIHPMLSTNNGLVLPTITST